MVILTNVLWRIDDDSVMPIVNNPRVKSVTIEGTFYPQLHIVNYTVIILHLKPLSCFITNIKIMAANWCWKVCFKILMEGQYVNTKIYFESDSIFQFLLIYLGLYA